MKNKSIVSLLMLISSFTLLACTNPTPTVDGTEPTVKVETYTNTEPSEELTQSWNLVQGTPPLADPTPIIYEGQVELSGWIEEKVVYGDETLPHFHVEDKSKIPSHLTTQNFLLLDENGKLLEDSLIDELNQKSEAMPLTILVDQLKINMEGSPSLRFVKIVN